MSINPTVNATDWTPTSAAPGSPEKIRVLRERARLRLPLFHPFDATGARQRCRIDPKPPPRRTGKSRKRRSVSAGRYIYRLRVGFHVRITRKGIMYRVGYFRTFEEALAARDAFLRKRGELKLAS